MVPRYMRRIRTLNGESGMAGCGLGAGGGCDEHGAAVAAVGIESDLWWVGRWRARMRHWRKHCGRDLKCVRLLAGAEPVFALRKI